MVSAPACPADLWLLFATRSVRLFAYGFVSVILVLYLAEVGLGEREIGLLLTMTLIGDTAISLWITTRADRLGRKRMLIAGAALMLLGGAVFAATGNFWLLLAAATDDRWAVRRSRLGLHRSRGVVLTLSALFALDAFAGGFVLQSFVAYWFHARFGADPATLGAIFFGANLLAGISALAAAAIARRVGLLNTMVFTHVPSNLLLITVPFMPTLP